MADDDPFACFDDSDDDGSNDSNDSDASSSARNNNQQQDLTRATTGTAAAAAALVRNAECGVLAFHRGTEQSLLHSVRNTVLATTTATTATTVMKAIDDFCTQRHWMMHVGPNKSRQLETFLRDECLVAATKHRRNDITFNKPFVLLELGTYCGYSCIFWASTLMRLLGDGAGDNDFFHVYTVEANPEFIRVARGLIELAGLTSKITVLHLDILGENQQLIHLLRTNNITSTACRDDDTNILVDLVFLDHDKDAYLDDLQDLETAGIVRKGVHVAADNVLFARIDGYRDYMQHHADKGIVKTKLVKGALEYSEMEQPPMAGDFEDGIELSVYIKDPPTPSYTSA